MKNVYLIGMMGAGKTVTAKALAQQTGRSFVDIDQVIQKNTNMTINEIFQKKNEDFFRQEEKKALEEVSKGQNLIVATSGGVVLDSSNIDKMKQTGEVVYLEASLDTLWNRVQNKKDRPLLHTEDPRLKLNEIFTQRQSLYLLASNGMIIKTDGLSPKDAANEIFKRYFY